MSAYQQKNQGLQAGRALAALAVAYFHSYMLFNGWPQGYVLAIPGLKEHGYLGVNFFFAISGFVISSVCDKPAFSPREFLIKRCFRLYPVYWAVIALTVVLKPLGVQMPGALYRAGHIAYSMTLLPQSVTPFYQVTWSLEYEVMFYLLAVLITPFLGLWGLAAVLFGLVRWAVTSPPDFFTLHLVAALNADFLAGVLAYLLRKPMSYIPAAILIAAGLFGYYAVAILQIPFSGSVGGFLLVSGLLNARWSWNRAPLTWLVRLGDASYSLYLVHFILIWIVGTAFGFLGHRAPSLAEPLRFAYLAVCISAALLMWERIEKPMIALGNKIASGVTDKAVPADVPKARAELTQPPAAETT
jgi:peptidoglycan/LPS O-acetylase OafA/YrhL